MQTDGSGRSLLRGTHIPSRRLSVALVDESAQPIAPPNLALEDEPGPGHDGHGVAHLRDRVRSEQGDDRTAVPGGTLLLHRALGVTSRIAW